MNGHGAADGGSAEHPPADGWAALAASAAGLLEQHGRLAVSGPWGAGKTTLLESLDVPAGWRRLRIHTQDGDQDVPFGALAQVMDLATALSAPADRNAEEETRTEHHRPPETLPTCTPDPAEGTGGGTYGGGAAGAGAHGAGTPGGGAHGVGTPGVGRPGVEARGAWTSGMDVPRTRGLTAGAPGAEMPGAGLLGAGMPDIEKPGTGTHGASAQTYDTGTHGAGPLGAGLLGAGPLGAGMPDMETPGAGAHGASAQAHGTGTHGVWTPGAGTPGGGAQASAVLGSAARLCAVPDAQGGASGRSAREGDPTSSDRRFTAAPSAEGPSAGTPGTGTPGTGTPRAGRPSTYAPDTSRPGTRTPGAGRPGTGTPDTDRPGTGRPSAGTPGTGAPDTGRPGTGTPDTDRPGTGRPGAGAPGACAPDSGTPRAGSGSYAGADLRLRMRLALAEVLGGEGPVLLLVDGAQWVDAASADVLGHCARTLPADRLAVVAAERTAAHPAFAARLLGGHPPLLQVQPADRLETAAALERSGLPARWAAPVHRFCGGNRALLAAGCRALAAAAALPDPSAGTDHAPYGLPGRRQVRELAAQWLASVPADVRTSLQTAALARHPDADLLRRAGCPGAEDHLEHAVRCGLLTPDEAYGPRSAAPPRTRFAADALAEAAAATATAPERRRIHAALAGAVHDPVQRARHRALAQEAVDQATAEDTAQAAAVARGAGERLLAAELMMLAARLTPADRPALRLDRLCEAARDAAAAGSADLAQEAASRIAEDRGSPAQRVHALLAVADARGQDLAGTGALLATARRTAAADPALLAAVELRTAVQVNVAAGDAALALHHAGAATVLARECGDAPLEAAALTMAARMERVLGRLDSAPVTLAAALALAVPPPRIGIRNSPEYLAARHAVFDGRLAQARRILTDLLPAAQGSGEAEDLVDIWRSLAEVDCGLGACSRALQWSALAVDLTASAGLSPGPAWYTAALAHSHGGSFPQALRYAAQGLRSSREEHDALHTTRSLWILGAVHLHQGHVEQAATALAEVDVLEAHAGAADPAVLRWQADAVEAFAASGRTARAHALLDRMQDSVGPHPGHAALRAALTRSRAACLHLDGEHDEAVELLEDAARAFTVLGRPVEAGRTHLARGRVERRRRRAAAARSAWESARTVLEEAGARPWAALAEDHLSHLTGQSPAPGAAGGGRCAPELTEHELRLAALVCAGATNQEAAQQMFISAKTVESTLSRIYRKLGIRNRTQLTATLSP